MYNHCNICNVPIYFCNIHMKHLQHTSATSITLETDASNMRFQAQHLLAAYEMEAHQHICGVHRRQPRRLHHRLAPPSTRSATQSPRPPDLSPRCGFGGRSSELRATGELYIDELHAPTSLHSQAARRCWAKAHVANVCSSVSDVSEVCCKCFIWMLQK